jgi:hypothetical protein
VKATMLAAAPSLRALVLSTIAAVCIIPSAAFAAPGLLVELTHRDAVETVPREVRADATFLVDVRVNTDGTWTADGRTGRLTPRDRALLMRAANRARLRVDPTPRAICTGIPNRINRVRTRRGAFSWMSPCAREPEPATLALIALTRTLTSSGAVAPSEPEQPATPTPEPPAAPVTSTDELVRYEHHSMEDFADNARLVLFADGRVEGLEGPARLSPEGLREIERMMRNTVIGAAPRDRTHACAARLTGQASIRVRDRGAHSWSTPCGQPDASIHALLARIRALAVR